MQVNTKKLTEMVANNLVSKQKVDKAVAFDPAIIMVIAQVIQLIIESLKNCGLFTPRENKPVKALEVVQSPSLIERFMLKRIIRKTGVDSRIEARKVYEAVVATGKDVKNDDLIGAANELDFDLI